MKILFIPAKSKIDISDLLKRIKIGGKIGVVSTVQFTNQLKQAKKILKNSILIGEILGCDIKKAKIAKVNSFLFIGSPYFHPVYLAYKTKKPVYILNPFTNKFSKVSETEITDFEKRKKGKLLKFYSAKKYGILVSTKPGQYNLKEALELQKKLKNSFIFIFNTLNLDELENFPDIDCWINTACPRIEGKSIINLEDVVPNLR